MDKLNDKQQYIIDSILIERQYQDTKWGEQNHNADKWGMIIAEEFGETCQAINEFGFNPNRETEDKIIVEAIQTMASCMAMIECIYRNRK
ncbi:MAG: hypothetical protein K0R00_3176 [Herbinix sp.]|nr:hypothetical protein [Herbinix sp.]